MKINKSINNKQQQQQQKEKRIEKKIHVMSPFVINVPTRDPLAPYTKQSF